MINDEARQEPWEHEMLAQPKLFGVVSEWNQHYYGHVLALSEESAIDYLASRGRYHGIRGLYIERRLKITIDTWEHFAQGQIHCPSLYDLKVHPEVARLADSGKLWSINSAALGGTGTTE